MQAIEFPVRGLDPQTVRRLIGQPVAPAFVATKPRPQKIVSLPKDMDRVEDYLRRRKDTWVPASNIAQDLKLPTSRVELLVQRMRKAHMPIEATDKVANPKVRWFGGS